MESDKTARSLLETAIDIARLGTWRARPGASVFEASARCCALFGFDPSGRRMPVGETFDRIHEASRARVAAAYACIEREGGSYAERYRVKHPDGTVLWLDETARGEVGPDGQVVWLVGVVRDVTEEIEARRRADEAAVLFEEAVDGLLLVGADGIVRAVNPALTRLLADHAEGWVSRPLFHGLPGLPREVVQAVRSGEPWAGDVTLDRAEGALPVVVKVSTIPNNSRLVTISDRRSHQAAQAQLRTLLSHDALTGLPNGRGFVECLAAAAPVGARRLVLLLDVDRFRRVNAEVGVEIANRLLTEVAGRLRSLPDLQCVARVGADTFGLLWTVADLADANVRVQQAQSVFDAPFATAGLTLPLSARVGGLVSASGDVEVLSRGAGRALAHAPPRGVALFEEDFVPLPTVGSLKLEGELREALARGELRVFYQPQVSLVSGALLGAEALVRWQHPTRGLLAPAQFLPVAQAAGLMPAIDAVVLAAASDQWLAWGAPGRLAVNVCSAWLSSDALLDQIDAALARGLPGPALEIEMTEETLAAPWSAIRARFDALHARGVTTAIDDFGVGFSSLSRLRRLRPTRLKIDRAFVTGLPDDADDLAIADLVVGLGARLGIEVLAEGIERQAQLDALRSLGCVSGQGYLFGRPEPAEVFTRRLPPKA